MGLTKARKTGVASLSLMLTISVIQTASAVAFDKVDVGLGCGAQADECRSAIQRAKRLIAEAVDTGALSDADALREYDALAIAALSAAETARRAGTVVDLSDLADAIADELTDDVSNGEGLTALTFDLANGGLEENDFGQRMASAS